VSVRPWTLLDLLGTINTEVQEANTNILIASHGNAGGLILPLYQRTSARADVTGMAALRDQSSPPVGSGLDSLKWKELRVLMAQVQPKGLQHVALRACMISDLSVLRQIRLFFNAVSISTVGSAALAGAFNGYGVLRPHRAARSADWTAFLRQHRSPQLDEQMPHGRVVVHFQQTGPITARTSMLVESQDALREWAYRHFPGGPHPLSVGHSFPCHYLTTDQGHSRILFPGDDGYSRFMNWEDKTWCPPAI
jgi:hypothetical protein